MSLELAYQFGTQRIKFIEAISHSCRTLEYIFTSNDDIALATWMFRGEREALSKLLINFLKFYSEYEFLLSNCPEDDVYGKNLIANAYKLLDSAPDYLKDRRFVTPVLEEFPLKEVSVVSPPNVQEVAYICDKVSITSVEKCKVKFVRFNCTYLELSYSTVPHEESALFEKPKKFTVVDKRPNYNILPTRLSNEPDSVVPDRNVLHPIIEARPHELRHVEFELRDYSLSRLVYNRKFLRLFWMYFSFLDFCFDVLLVGLMLYFLIVLGT
eukprot:TCONS_00003985-protein